MKSLSKTYFLLAALLFITVQQSKAQSAFAKHTRKKTYINVGAFLGPVNYFGDLVPKSKWGSFDFTDTRPAVTLYGTWKRSPNLRQRFSISWMRISGDDYVDSPPLTPEENPEFFQFDIFRYRRNLHFRNDLIEVAQTFIWDIKGAPGVFYRRYSSWNPYVFAGVALLYSNPKAKAPEGNWGEYQQGDWVPLRLFQTEGQEKPYSFAQFAVPFGIGVRKAITMYFDFSAEIGYRAAFTDYLDDVSTSYTDLSFWQSSGQFKGGPKKNSEEDNIALAQALSDRSREIRAEYADADRVPELIGNSTITYESRYDGTRYEVLNGYGHEWEGGGPEGFFRTKRGDIGDKDAFIFVGLSASYIFDRGVKTPRFGAGASLRRVDFGSRKQQRRVLRSNGKKRGKYQDKNQRKINKMKKSRLKMKTYGNIGS